MIIPENDPPESSENDHTGNIITFKNEQIK